MELAMEEGNDGTTSCPGLYARLDMGWIARSEANGLASAKARDID
jgi:hypothetical protein